jgi:ATP-dependent Lon protease
MEKSESPQTTSSTFELPVLPLRDVVVYPHMVIPLFVGREKSIHALDAAMSSGSKQILLVAQKEASEDSPAAKDIYAVGAVSTILQLLKLPDGTVKVLVEGVRRGRVIDFVQSEPYFLVNAEYVGEGEISEEGVEVLTRK